jgi:2-methylcitrate dehydratase
MPEQFLPDRVGREDVQTLLRRVVVRPEADLSRRFPDEHACRVRIRLTNGRMLSMQKHDYEGFHTRPMRWETVVSKFKRLSEPYADGELRKEIVEAVASLEEIGVRDLTEILTKAKTKE